MDGQTRTKMAGAAGWVRALATMFRAGPVPELGPSRRVMNDAQREARDDLLRALHDLDPAFNLIVHEGASWSVDSDRRVMPKDADAKAMFVVVEQAFHLVAGLDQDLGAGRDPKQIAAELDGAAAAMERWAGVSTESEEATIILAASSLAVLKAMASFPADQWITQADISERASRSPRTVGPVVQELIGADYAESRSSHGPYRATTAGRRRASKIAD